jgi:hypothetical protein
MVSTGKLSKLASKVDTLGAAIEDDDFGLYDWDDAVNEALEYREMGESDWRDSMSELIGHAERRMRRIRDNKRKLDAAWRAYMEEGRKLLAEARSESRDV